tara:strand:+ start:31 stop:729 length:699 start_codon:yes stop_codon:yes gene_type:complete
MEKTPEYFLRNRKGMKVLELFSGTGSVGKICNEYNYDCVSVDITDKLHPVTHLVDILKWDYTIYEPGHFDMIWASPPCASFSSLLFLSKTKEQIQQKMNTVGIPLLAKAIEIIDYFKPKYYFIENPKTGRMKNYITELPYYDITYCKYGFSYFKPTRIWTNLENFKPKYCRKTTYCNHKLEFGKHQNHIGGTRKNANGKFPGYTGKNFKLAEKYQIPPNLIRSIFDTIHMTN